MTLVLYIAHTNGAVLIGDRISTLEKGPIEEVNKIRKISDDTVIAFSGPTEASQYIIDYITSKSQIEKRDLGPTEIQTIIKDEYYKLKRDGAITSPLEFFLVMVLNNQIRLWRIRDGVPTVLNPNQNYGIGQCQAINPNLTLQWSDMTFESAYRFGVDLIGWTSLSEPIVGSPATHGCTVCNIDGNGITLTNYRDQIVMENVQYRFHDRLPDETFGLYGKVVHLGYISSTTVGLETGYSLIKNIIESDLNEYASKLGYNVKFEFIVEDAAGNTGVHLEKVHELKTKGVDIFLGGGWSSQAQAALSYCNDNNMLMVSASSTSPLLAIPDDNFYRLCPDDTVQAPVIAEMLRSCGIKAIVLMQRGDAWADGIVNYFEPEFTGNGGVILERIRYAGEATEFSNYLQLAEDKVALAVETYGPDHVAVLLISFSESVVIVTQAQDYPTLYDLIWYGSDGTTLSQQHCDDAPNQTVKLKLYSPYAAPAESEIFSNLYDRYYNLVNQPFGYYSACTYDAAWLLAKAILETQSTNTNVIKTILPDLAKHHFGASGWTKLNEAGDRYTSNYQIWSYRWEGPVVVPYVAGLYDSVTGKIIWYSD